MLEGAGRWCRTVGGVMAFVIGLMAQQRMARSRRATYVYCGRVTAASMPMMESLDVVDAVQFGACGAPFGRGKARA